MVVSSNNVGCHMGDKAEKYSAWSPGLGSDIPAHLLPLVTLYRAENATVDYAHAKEAADFCGLEPRDMAAFRLERLIVHEVLIRVTADLSVPDGPNYEELGLNMRGMAARIVAAHVHPQLDELRKKFDKLRSQASAKLDEILDRDIYQIAPATSAKAPGFIGRLFGKTTTDEAPSERAEVGALKTWRAQLNTEDDALTRACLQALLAVVGGIVGQRGRLMADKAMITKFALNMVSNGYGSTQVGTWVDPIIAQAAKAEGYRYLPTQAKPFFMNVKGASAAGKSTVRPAQRKLAQKLNIPWEDFALISPDYWRKMLLDYESLGDDFKYAAMLTGQELEIIDKKLDRYMETKAARKELPHLLIDRFRFDSFDVSKELGKNSQLLTRFGDTVFLFFIVTPPAATVERAWKRGLETGRYKAVDDLLYHNIEAYTGMPNLFFSGVLATDKKIHFEFLDNSVDYGKPPRTIAYGWNGQVTILDLQGMNNIERFKNVNIAATRPQDVLEPVDTSFAFLKSCLARIPDVTLADQKSGRIYGKAKDGEWVFKDASALGETDPFVHECLTALGWEDFTGDASPKPLRLDVAGDRHDTLGEWGVRSRSA